MEKCPKCGYWSFSINTRYEVLECLRIECRYQEPVDVGLWLKNHNDLPKLARSLYLH